MTVHEPAKRPQFVGWRHRLGCIRGCRNSAGSLQLRMFRWVGHSLRARGAIVLVAIYTVCAVVPSAVLATSHGTFSSYCLSKNRPHEHSMHSGHLADVVAVSHVDGISHTDTPGDKYGTSKTCCGMLCVSAIATNISVFPARTSVSSAMKISLEQFSVGSEGIPLIRPPIAL